MIYKKCSLIVVLLTLFVVAQEEDKSSLKINALGWYTLGYPASAYMSSMDKKSEFGVDFDEADYNLTGSFVSNALGGLRVEKTILDGYKGRFAFALLVKHAQPDKDAANVVANRRGFGAMLLDAAVERTFELGISDDRLLKMEFGFFPVKYNPESQNLGEYLFRSTPYPAVIFSAFEYANVTTPKLVGYHLGFQSNMGESTLKLDGYITSEYEYYPMYDISPSLLFSFSANKVFDFGCGIMGHHLISVNEGKTTPGKDEERRNIPINGAMYYYLQNPREVIIPDSISPFTGQPAVETVYDTTFYTFRGTKVVARATFNPRKLIGGDLLGPNDLKIYAEMAILGLKNYPGWYENIAERIPIMFGFNIPTFKLLDVCSIEFQWFGSKYWNTWENVWKNATPTPYVGFSRYESYEDWSDVTINPDDDSSEVARKQSYKEYAHMDRDNWKWSLYMAKWLNKRIKLSLIFANDNSPKSLYGPGAPFASKFTEMTHRTWWNGKWGMIWDWYWMARVMFYF